MTQTKLTKYLIFDFDSTIISVESLEVLAEETLKHNPGKNEILKKITNITNQGMSGEITFTQSLAARLKLFQSSKKHISDTAKILRSKISSSILRNQNFFKKYQNNIIVVSGSFYDLVLPVTRQLAIPDNKVFANNFNFAGNQVCGIDEFCLLAQDMGKVTLIKSLNLNGAVYFIGDGYTDYQTKEQGAADKFFAYTENVNRPGVVKNADHIIKNLDELIPHL